MCSIMLCSHPTGVLAQRPREAKSPCSGSSVRTSAAASVAHLDEDDVSKAVRSKLVTLPAAALCSTGRVGDTPAGAFTAVTTSLPAPTGPAAKSVEHVLKYLPRATEGWDTDLERSARENRRVDHASLLNCEVTQRRFS